jgi:hypothetical protein
MPKPRTPHTAQRGSTRAPTDPAVRSASLATLATLASPPPPPPKRKRGRPALPIDERLRRKKARNNSRAEMRQKLRELAREVREDVVAREGARQRAGLVEEKREPNEFVPTLEMRQQVQTFAALGTPHEHIALFIINPMTGLPIDDVTLRKNFGYELAVGPARANANVAQKTYEGAIGSGREAAISRMFWLKCRAGWQEKPQQHQLQIEIKAGVLVAPAVASPEQWIAAAASANAEKTEPGK